LISQTHVVSANCGDSRALLWRLDGSGDPTRSSCPQGNKSNMVLLTHDHKPGDWRERKRIDGTDGYSVVSSVEGPARQLIHRIQLEGWATPNVNLSRALGDFHCKPNRTSPELNPISPVPHTQIARLDDFGSSSLTRFCWNSTEAERSFLFVVASDGVVNERFENKQIVGAVQSVLQRHWDRMRPSNAQEFMDKLTQKDWQDCVDNVLTMTEQSNWGDNQSIHIAFLRRKVDVQAVVSPCPCPD